MHYPSERVSKEMSAEPASTWFVPAEGTDTHAILLKAPTNILKAIIVGCSVDMTFGVVESKGKRILCTATRIYDDKVSPFVESGVQRFREDFHALIEILQRATTPIFLFDELSRCVSWAETSFEQEKINELLELVGDPETLFDGKFDSDASEALDCLDFSINPSRNIEKGKIIPIVTLSLSFGEFNNINLTAFGIHEIHSFNLDEKQEGAGLEQSVWHLLENLFSFRIYRSPKVFMGGKARELTDILCLSKYGIFIFETKEMAILSTSRDRSMEKKVRGIQKQIKKGLGQICGSVRTIRAGNKISSDGGTEITFDTTLVPHGIIVVSELLPFGTWDDIVQEAFTLMVKHKIIIHIIDLRELRLLIGGSKNPDISIIT